MRAKGGGGRRSGGGEGLNSLAQTMRVKRGPSRLFSRRGGRCVGYKERVAGPCRGQIETCPYVRLRLSPSIAAVIL